MPRLSGLPQEPTRTQAAVTYWSNSQRSALLVQVVVEAGQRLAHRVRDLASSGVTVADEKLSDELNDVWERLKKGSSYMHDAATVMTVTFGEAFLQDVLVELALVDRSVLGDASPTVALPDIDLVGSLEALKLEALSRWARAFVDDGGPKRWTERLERMGVPEVGADVDTLEKLWGVRHILVHRNGLASPEFIRRHPDLACNVGERVALTPDRLNAYIEAVDRFVCRVDAAFGRRIATKQR